MKTRYIYWALTAIVACAACEKEAQQEPEQQPVRTVLQVGIADTKTYLGDADAQHHRKVYWSNGDQIAVNGTPSEALAGLAANTASAEFTLTGAISTPYNVLYPASIYTDATHVTLPAVQTYKAGGIADNMLPLAGYSADGSNLSLTHLCAVVKVSVKRSSAVDADTDNIVAVRFKGKNNEKVSGAFEVNYSSPQLSAAAAGSDAEKEVRVAKSLATSTSAAIDYYLVVPARTYSNGFDVIVQDVKGDIMTKSKATSITLEPGHLYAMAEFDFVPSGTETGLEISSAEELIAFATAYNNKEFGDDLVATITDDITFNASTSAAFNATGGIGLKNGVHGTEDYYFKGVFNGNSENYSISGLEATVPLFTATDSDGIIKNLTLENTCSFEFTHANTIEGMFGSVVGYHKGTLDNVKVAADISLAAVASVTYMTTLGGLAGRTTVGKLQHGCEYSGLISTPAGFTSTNKVIIGGLVGRFSNAGSISDCFFKGAISNAAQVTSTDKSNPYLIIGGVVGHLDGGASVSSTNTTADHEAVASAYAGGTGILVNKTTVAYNTAVGGIVGEVVSGSVSSCDNGATILNTIIRTEDAQNTNARYMETGGIVGRNGASGTVDNCNNNATVYHRSNPRLQRIGGIVGQNVANGTISNCTNNADVAHMTTGVAGDAKLYGGRVISLGGIVGDNASSNISNVQNAAVLSISRTEAQTANAVDVALGGVIGNNTASIDGGGSKNISNTGKVYYNTNMNVVPIGYSLGGVVGKTTSSIQNVVNSGYVHMNWTASTAQKVYLGGIVGQVLEGENHSSPETILISGCNNIVSAASNSGEVNLGVTTADVIHTNCIAGGIVGYVNNYKVNISNCDNSGYVHAIPNNVTITDSGVYVGGIVGYLTGASAISSCNNTGYTNINGGNNTDDNMTKIFADGGIVGIAKGTDAGHITISDCDWSYSTKSVGSRRGTCAGIAAYAEYVDISDCDVTVDYNMYNHVTAGNVGWAVNSTMTNCKYHGETIASTQGYWSAGIVAKLTSESVVDGCYNYCENITATKAPTVRGEIAAISESGTTIRNCHHTGTIGICSDTNFTDGGGNAADL